ncbi:hypothetical protein ACFL1Q_02825 [Patescibacteria group bacterium]
MSAENSTITVEIYKDGEPTGETQELDLTDPEVCRQIMESLNKQPGEFD